MGVSSSASVKVGPVTENVSVKAVPVVGEKVRLPDAVGAEFSFRVIDARPSWLFPVSVTVTVTVTDVRELDKKSFRSRNTGLDRPVSESEAWMPVPDQL
jgi:hypothetical protein